MGKSDELIFKNDYVVEFQKKIVFFFFLGMSLEFYNICGFVFMLKEDEEVEESRINVEFLIIESIYKELVFGR